MTITRYLRLKTEPLIGCIGRVLYCIFRYSWARKFSLLTDAFYTAWIANAFNKTGKGIIFYHPLTIVGGKHISIGANTRIGRHSVVTAWDCYEEQNFSPLISIGSDCNLGEYNHLSCINRITIGNGVLTGRWITIVDNGHGDDTLSEKRPESRSLFSKGGVVIGDHVWIGDKVTVLPGITIGNNAIIGANSVVTHDIPENAIAAGNPAKVIKFLKLK